MATRDAFLDAIRAAPADDAPRLIYADWLDEQGDEAQSARADFIRLQIARCATVPDSPESDELLARESDLHRRFGEAWEAEFAGHGVRVSDYERGFPTILHLRDEHLAAPLAELARRAPGLRGARLVRLGEVLRASWLQEPPPFPIASLALDRSDSHNFPGREFQPDDAQMLTRSPWLNDVEGVSFAPFDEPLYLAWHPDRVLIPLLQAIDSGRPERLRTLDLTANWRRTASRAVPVERLLPLAGLSLFARIDALILAHNEIDDAFNQVLEGGDWTALRTLILARASFESRELLPIPAKMLPRLTTLDLSAVRTNRGWPYDNVLLLLAESRQHLTALQSLDLSDAGLTAGKLQQRRAQFRLDSLTRLRLDHNPLGPSGARALAEAPLCSTLRELRLVSTGLGDGGVWALAGSQNLFELETLDLRGNEISPWAKTALFESPRLPNLQRLYV